MNPKSGSLHQQARKNYFYTAVTSNENVPTMNIFLKNFVGILKATEEKSEDPDPHP
jgi:hypothetical protein